VQAAGFAVRGFSTPAALLQSEIPQTGACLVVDVNLPGMNGIELCRVLEARGCGLPAIVITGRTDDPATDRLIQGADAVAVLYKPFPAAVLLDALSAAF
jgi:two-component system response regulator FixJ